MVPAAQCKHSLLLFRFFPALCCGPKTISSVGTDCLAMFTLYNWARLVSIAASLKFIVLVGNLAFCVRMSDSNFRNREWQQGEQMMAWVWSKTEWRMFETYFLSRSHWPPYVRMKTVICWNGYRVLLFHMENSDFDSATHCRWRFTSTNCRWKPLYTALAATPLTPPQGQPPASKVPEPSSW